MKTGVRHRLWILAIPFLAVAALLISGCSSSDSDTDGDSANELSVSNAWVKATDGTMTGAFALITNKSGEEVKIVSATTTASKKTELHETVETDGKSVMQAKPGGFSIPAGESLTLQPGGNHIMIMGLTKPIKAGDQVSVSMTLESGDPVEFQAQAKESSAGEEPYHDNDSTASPTASMDMG